MGELAIIDKTGDTKVMWDKNNDDEVEAAEDQFDNLIDKGFTAYKVKKDGEKGGKIKKFDAKAGKIIMVPKIVGG
ncbi:MAG: hypothetical protein ACTSVO_05715 [Candidatus Heimdallarchaeaceae archaeon]